MPPLTSDTAKIPHPPENPSRLDPKHSPSVIGREAKHVLIVAKLVRLREKDINKCTNQQSSGLQQIYHHSMETDTAQMCCLECALLSLVLLTLCSYVIIGWKVPHTFRLATTEGVNFFVLLQGWKYFKRVETGNSLKKAKPLNRDQPWPRGLAVPSR